MSVQPKEGAGGIVLGRGGMIVLVNQFNNSWSFPKGGVEPGEELLAAAKREIAEETGIQEPELEYLCELGSYERKSIGPGGVGETEAWGSRKRTLFLFKTSAQTLASRDDEVIEARFVSIEDALQMLTHPKDADFLESVRTIVEQYAF